MRYIKQTICVILTLVTIMYLCACSDKDDIYSQPTTVPTQAESTSDYKAITHINHCAVEPDDRLHMTKQDTEYYSSLMNALLNRQTSVVLSDDVNKNEYYIDLLKQSPYYFFAKSCKINGNTILIEYAYSQEQQQSMLEFMDTRFLEIANAYILSTDNELDIILKVHASVAHCMTYDHQRVDNKQLSSPLFNYPADEIYKALKNNTSVCYGFAYTLRFVLLQHNIDCFCVYGPCANRNEAHMWNIFKYNDKFYTCDSAWDRSEEDYARLYHFGKTDEERFSDGLETREFSSTMFEEYGEIECTDETFRSFRGISRYSFIKDHTYYMVDFNNEELLFDSQTVTMK